MPRRPLGLLSFGVFVVIVAACLVAYAAGYITIIEEFLSLVIGFFGLWVIVIAGIRAKSPEKYERGAFSTFAWGILITAVGGFWLLYIWYPENLAYSLALLLVIIGILAVSAALRTWRK
ncbi:hypothetical protein GWO13_02585 [Candidatus Bathyarchaeota archaeon]|nr:hypothetical protein [Candidatus Bathyarchaeota archaeon]